MRTEARTLSGIQGRSRQRRRWLGPSLFLLLVLSIVFAPSTLTIRSIRHAIFDQLTAAWGWQLRCESVRLHWWSAVELRGVSLRSNEGHEIVTARRLTTQRSLMALCRNSEQLGLIQLEAPYFRGKVRQNGSEWEDWIGQLTSNDKPHARAGPRFNLQIQEGTIEVLPDGLPAWKIDSFQALIGVRTHHLQIDLKATLSDGSDWGTVKGSVEFPTATRTPPVLHLSCEQLPLFVLDTVALRSGQPLRARGALSGEVRLARTEQGRSLHGQFDWHQLSVECPALLDGDRLETDHLQTSFHLLENELEIDIRELEVTSDLVDLNAHGKLTLASTEPIWKTLEASYYSCQGRVNVAELSRQLPKTLHRRADTEVIAGQLNWELTNTREGPNRILTGQITSRGLRIRGPQERDEFVQPLEMDFLARVEPDRWHLERLSGKSTFLEFSGQGDTQVGQLTVRGDLQQLRSELSQFIDLGFLRLDGVVDGKMTWQTMPSGELATRGTFEARDLRVAVSQRNWHEPHLNLSIDTVLQGHTSDRPAWTTGHLQMHAGKDRLDIRLTEAVPWHEKRWPLEVALYGDLKHWRHRLRGLVTFPVPPIEGTIETRLSLLRNQHHFQLSVPTAEIRDFYLELPGIQLQEPRIRIAGGGSWNSEDATLALTESSLASTAFALRIGSLSYSPRRGGFPNVQLSYRGDLERMWLAVPRRHRHQIPSGSFAGLLTLSDHAGATQFSGQADFENLRWLARRTRAVRNSEPRRDWQTIWHEPELRFRTIGQVTPTRERIQFDQLELDSTVANLRLQGEVNEPWGTPRLQLQGQSSLNLEQISSRLAPTWGDQLRMAGHVRRPFQISGPLRPTSTLASTERLRPVSTSASRQPTWLSPELQAAVGIGWDQIHACGFDFESGKIDLKLENQEVWVLPLELATCGGRIQMTPRLRLDHPLRVEFAAGQVVEQVQITPEMCRGWLKFVAPLLADVTAAHGRFSVALDRASIPLADPTTSQFRGTLQIHAAEIGAGATARQILSVIRQIQSIARPNGSQSSNAMSDWIIVPQQNVSFQMLDGKIYHDQLRVVIGDVPVQTRGWVDVDEQINLVARVPIQESWVGKDRWLAGLLGQTIEIPIRGSLQKPRVDQNFLNDLARKTVQRTAESLLQEEMQKQLNRLFD